MVDRTYLVYKHTTPSGKVYIGLTCQTSLGRWGKNGNGYKNAGHFRNAIRKYGWENIAHEVVAEGLTKDEAASLEIELIRKYDSRNPLKGYNQQVGGELGWLGMTHTEEARRKIHLSKLGPKNHMYGKHHTEEFKAYMHCVNSHPKSEETRERMRIAQSNRSEETRKRLSDSQKKNPVRNIDTGEVYLSVSEAARAFNSAPGNLCACLKGRRKTWMKCRWEYVDIQQVNTEVTIENKSSIAP